jgi:hypothetical protein
MDETIRSNTSFKTLHETFMKMINTNLFFCFPICKLFRRVACADRGNYFVLDNASNWS